MLNSKDKLLFKSIILSKKFLKLHHVIKNNFYFIIHLKNYEKKEIYIVIKTIGLYLQGQWFFIKYKKLYKNQKNDNVLYKTIFNCFNNVECFFFQKMLMNIKVDITILCSNCTMSYFFFNSVYSKMFEYFYDINSQLYINNIYISKYYNSFLLSDCLNYNANGMLRKIE
jgi:hypothetical protein